MKPAAVTLWHYMWGKWIDLPRIQRQANSLPTTPNEQSISLTSCLCLKYLQSFFLFIHIILILYYANLYSRAVAPGGQETCILFQSYEFEYCFLNGQLAATFLSLQTINRIKNCRLKRDLNSNLWSRRQACWPLDHHQCPSLNPADIKKIFYFYVGKDANYEKEAEFACPKSFIANEAKPTNLNQLWRLGLWDCHFNLGAIVNNAFTNV